MARLGGSRNSRVERRVTRREVDQIRATSFIESRMLVFLTEREIAPETYAHS